MCYNTIVRGSDRMNKIYACIDLKSFYASVECVERGLNPLNTNLVVADERRTEKTICLAVTPSLKAYGIGGRSRLFEVIQRVKEINKERKSIINGKFTSKSYIDSELKENKYLELDFIKAVPRMNLYMNYSARIYEIYLKYISKEDIYVYSIDEVFIDLTPYLNYYEMSYEEIIRMIIKDVYLTTGITATGGIGTNLYLAKVAMDIVAKKKEADEFGVRIAFLDEYKYRELLWSHKPLTDFWRIGPGIARKLKYYYIDTMKDICICSLENEDLLYKLFGVNAELIIDHAWGYENCTLKDIKSYTPKSKSISEGQVLHKPYNYNNSKLIIEEMSELLSLDLTKRKYITDLLSLSIGYDICNIDDDYDGIIEIDHYGRETPKGVHSSIRLDYKTSDYSIIRNNLVKLFDSIVNKKLYIRRINISASNLEEDKYINKIKIKQLDLFNEYKEPKKDNSINLQREILNIKYRYGKNSIVKGMNLMKEGTMMDRNKEVGGHSA